MIPKMIHYCWFGGKPLPKDVLDCIKTWKKYCPDYEIKRWDESNFDVNSHPFMKAAYEAKAWAFVSDYARLKVVYDNGGIYLDTDVELKKNIDCFLKYDAFSCFETEGIPFTSAVWGSQKNHSLLKKLLNYYQNKEFSLSESPNTLLIGNILEKKFNINPLDNINQIGSDGVNSIHIFSSNYFCLDLPENYASHHFFDSWASSKKKNSYKNVVHEKYYINRLKLGSSYSKNTIKNISKNWQKTTL